MRTLEVTTTYRRDLKRELKGRYRATVREDVLAVARFLLSEAPLPAQRRDHNLSGNWAGYRECHVKPDLLLIYRLTDDAVQFVRLGSHSELF